MVEEKEICTLNVRVVEVEKMLNVAGRKMMWWSAKRCDGKRVKKDDKDTVKGQDGKLGISF